MDTPERRAAASNTASSRDWDAAANVVAQMARKLSGAGRFVTVEEIREELDGLGLLPDAADEVRASLGEILRTAVAAHADLVPVEEGTGELRLYSSRFMTPAYAGLLLRNEGDRLRLIAETVRENSSLYPRPIPLGAFEQPPFCLTREEILACVQTMVGEEGFRDIARTRTSAGNEYFYSTTHLEPDHAAGLAEWIDVGQYDNP